MDNLALKWRQICHSLTSLSLASQGGGHCLASQDLGCNLQGFIKARSLALPHDGLVVFDAALHILSKTPPAVRGPNPTLDPTGTQSIRARKNAERTRAIRHGIIAPPLPGGYFTHTASHVRHVTHATDTNTERDFPVGGPYRIHSPPTSEFLLEKS